MNRFISICLSFIILFLLFGCQQQVSNDEREQKVKEPKSNKTQALDVREAVWNQLTEKEKEHIAGSWKDASVQKITLRESMGQIEDKTFVGREVYIVDYPSKDSPSLGGIGVYADIKSHRIIGFSYRE
ncbi:hypothetical protein ABEW00_21685 [Rossellomorea vietnamensis]|uniref:hypothetical protein n=1 Tax=Rossellomorea vietnamensis TaxID=218284 RepID=UPI003D271474